MLFHYQANFALIEMEIVTEHFTCKTKMLKLKSYLKFLARIQSEESIFSAKCQSESYCQREFVFHQSLREQQDKIIIVYGTHRGKPQIIYKHTNTLALALALAYMQCTFKDLQFACTWNLIRTGSKHSSILISICLFFCSTHCKAL